MRIVDGTGTEGGVVDEGGGAIKNDKGIEEAQTITPIAVTIEIEDGEATSLLDWSHTTFLSLVPTSTGATFNGPTPSLHWLH